MGVRFTSDRPYRHAVFTSASAPHGASRADDKRHKLLSAARECFAVQGFAATHLTEVAGAAGMQKSTFFHYYADKEELYAEAVVTLLDRAACDIEASVALATCMEDRIERFMDVLHHAVASHGHFQRLLMRALTDAHIDSADPASAEPAAARIVTQLLAIVAEGGRESPLSIPDPHVTARAILAVLCCDARSSVRVLDNANEDAGTRFAKLRTIVRQMLQLDARREPCFGTNDRDPPLQLGVAGEPPPRGG